MVRNALGILSCYVAKPCLATAKVSGRPDAGKQRRRSTSAARWPDSRTVVEADDVWRGGCGLLQRATADDYRFIDRLPLYGRQASMII